MKGPAGENIQNAIRARCGRLERVVSLKELLEGMIPERNERIERLKDVVRNWAAVVGPARARLSAPYELEDRELRIAATTPHAAQQIVNMKGNILRILKSRWNLDIEGIRVTLGPPPARPRPLQSVPGRRHARVVLPQEEVEALRRTCPEALSDEAAEGLARLRTYFAHRFPRA